MAWNLPIDYMSKVCSRRIEEFNRLARMLGNIAKHHLSECPVHRIENPMKMMISRSVVSMFGLALLATACGGGGSDGGGGGGGGGGCAGADTSALAGDYTVTENSDCGFLFFGRTSQIAIGNAGTVTNLDEFIFSGETVLENSVCATGAFRVVLDGGDYTVTVTGQISEGVITGSALDSGDDCTSNFTGFLDTALTGSWSGTFEDFFELPQAAWTMHVEPNGSILSMSIGAGTELTTVDVSGGVVRNAVHVEGLYKDLPFVIEAEVDQYGILQGQVTSEALSTVSIMKGELESSD